MNGFGQSPSHFQPLHSDGRHLDDGSGIVRYRRIGLFLDPHRHPQHLDGHFHFLHFRLQTKRVELVETEIPVAESDGPMLPVPNEDTARNATDNEYVTHRVTHLPSKCSMFNVSLSDCDSSSMMFL